MQLISSIAFGILANQALGAPTKPVSHLHTRHVVQQNWGGAVLEGNGYNYVTGVLTVPEITGKDPNSSASIWVGIDGNKCSTAILQTGITVWGDGSLDTWTEWWQYNEEYYPTSIQLRAGDKLRLTVHATSRTSGTTTIENLTQGGSQTKKFTSEDPYPLCETDAEWIIEDYNHNGAPVDFVDFGSIQFSNAYAQNGNGQKFSPANALFKTVRIDDQDRTRCSSDNDNVYCSYI